MPDIALIGGGPSEAAVNAAASAGISVTAATPANNKGSYTELIASTLYDTDWVLVTLSTVTGLRHAVDIAVGASTSEIIILPNMYISLSSVNVPMDRNYLFPLRIPRGTRLSARTQSSTASGVVLVSLHLISSPIDAPPGLGRVEALGMNLSGATRANALSDPGAVAHTDGAWTQLIAATSFSYRWMCLTISNVQNNIATSQIQHAVDVAIGAAGSEVEIISDILTWAHTTSDTPALTQVCMPVNIPAGVRVAARSRSSTTASGERQIDVAMWGVG